MFLVFDFQSFLGKYDFFFVVQSEMFGCGGDVWFCLLILLLSYWCCFQLGFEEFIDGIIIVVLLIFKK